MWYVIINLMDYQWNIIKRITLMLMSSICRLRYIQWRCYADSQKKVLKLFIITSGFFSFSQSNHEKFIFFSYFFKDNFKTQNYLVVKCTLVCFLYKNNFVNVKLKILLNHSLYLHYITKIWMKNDFKQTNKYTKF